MYIFENLFSFYFERRPWFQKKKFVIPVCIFMAVLIGGAIVGGTLGARSAAKDKGKIVLSKVF